MSIPKDPRQLMINIMYIVLTAMLALNLSAEILNAFFTIDNSLVESNALVTRTNTQMIASIRQQADAYRQYEPLSEKAEKLNEISNDFSQYIEAIKQRLVEESGGMDEEGLPKGKKEKDVTTRILIDEGVGMELEERISITKMELLDLIEEEEAKASLENRIPLKINPIPEDSEKKNWADFTFTQMPVAAVLPMLSKFQNDIQVSEAALLNHFLSKTNMEIKPNEFEAVVSADKSYVIKGERLNAEIFLGAYSSTADNIDVLVGGRKLPVRNGKAIFTTQANTLGSQELDVIVKVVNPLTGQVKKYPKKFKYEVGERSVTMAADKMNVLYIGVDNPISISAAGVPSKDVKVEASGLNIQKISNGKYNVKPSRSGIVNINVNAGPLNQTFEYRVKKIPDPIVQLGRKSGGSMSPNEFKAHKGIIPVLQNFDFKAECRIMGFELVRVPKKEDVQAVLNSGGKYSSEAQRLVDRAKSGDVYYFDKIKAKCPGDSAGREIPGLIFNIR